MIKIKNSGYSQADLYPSMNTTDHLLSGHETTTGVSLASTTPTNISELDATFPELDQTSIDTRKVENVNKRTINTLFNVSIVIALISLVCLVLCLALIPVPVLSLSVFIPLLIITTFGMTCPSILIGLYPEVLHRNYDTMEKSDEISAPLQQPIFTVEGGAKCPEIAPPSNRNDQLNVPPDTAALYEQRY